MAENVTVLTVVPYQTKNNQTKLLEQTMVLVQELVVLSKNLKETIDKKHGICDKKVKPEVCTCKSKEQGKTESKVDFDEFSKGVTKTSSKTEDTTAIEPAVEPSDVPKVEESAKPAETTEETPEKDNK